ncbi:inorganic diphosphatase [Streptomyces mirabilis]|uniref:inorganic diphosphatase n=1 Tax=Streptomyces sp. NPDC005388 TaxID=3156717 RepID=UPI0033BDE12B
MPRITVTVRSTVGSTMGRQDDAAHAEPEPPGHLGGWPVGQGSVPDTLGEDGRPVEALVLMQEPALPGDDVAAWPVAVLHVVDGDRRTDELLCIAETECFVDLVDVADLGRWHAEPTAWATALARLSPGSTPHVTDCGSRAEAEHLVEQTRHACQLLTGCLE